MRVILLMALFLGVAACERYTEKTSPCFGKNGEPVVSRSANSPLTFSTKSPGLTKNCTLEPVSSG
jgi:hypothetical protein